jgi:adenylate cyclase
VSRLHALVQRREQGEYCVVDLGSTNGTFVNGRRVSIPVTLTDNDCVVLGDQRLRFRKTSGASATIPEETLRNAPTAALFSHTMTTIVVVDIRDFTPLARSVSEELLSQTIGTWFLRVGQIAQNLGSWAQRYIGDAVMAVWVHDNAASTRKDLLHALQSIARIEEATSQISRSLPLPAPLRIGAGVNTGHAVIGSSDFTALGDTVNVAFRLEAATKNLGVGIAIGEQTFEALKVLPESERWFQRREVVLKGYEGASTAWAISFDALNQYLHTLHEN